MRYLNGTRDVCIFFGGKGPGVEVYTYTDYAGDMDKRRSTSGYVFMFTGGVVSWRSRLQNYTSMSTTVEMPTLHCDSQRAIMLAKNPLFHAKTKHIDVKYHS